MSQEVITRSGLAVPLQITMEPLFYGSYPERFELDDDIGHLSGKYSPKESEFEIGMVKVNDRWRQQGIGTQLIRIALQEAQDLKVEMIKATIVDPYCLAAMRNVFGEDALESMPNSPTAKRLRFLIGNT